MTENELFQQYKTIWEKYAEASFNKILQRGFMFQYDPDEQDCDLLFVGINPAFGKGEDSSYSSYSRPSNSDEQKVSYFKSFEFVSTMLQKEYSWNGKWTHLDIFVFRETNQNYIQDTLLRSKEGVSFLYDQILVARKRIMHTKPRVIVISNALVRMFTGKERILKSTGEELGVWMDFHFVFDKHLGTDVITTPAELAGTPVFFTSMLSGQRALDNGSKERLIWHISKILMG